MRVLNRNWRGGVPESASAAPAHGRSPRFTSARRALDYTARYPLTCRPPRIQAQGGQIRSIHAVIEPRQTVHTPHCPHERQKPHPTRPLYEVNWQAYNADIPARRVSTGVAALSHRSDSVVTCVILAAPAPSRPSFLFRVATTTGRPGRATQNCARCNRPFQIVYLAMLNIQMNCGGGLREGIPPRCDTRCVRPVLMRDVDGCLHTACLLSRGVPAPGLPILDRASIGLSLTVAVRAR